MRAAVLAAKVFVVPCGLLAAFIAFSFMGSGGGWLAGPELAAMGCAYVFGLYCILVVLSAVLGGILSLFMEKDSEGTAVVLIALLALAAFAGFFMLQ